MKWLDKGFVYYIVLILWFCIIIGVPSFIFDTEGVGLCGIIACCIGLAAYALTSDNKGMTTVRTEMPITYTHFWIFLAFAVSGMFKIGFSEMKPMDMKPLAQSLTVYGVYIVISFFIDAWIANRKEKDNQSATK